jgi:hypothetical protein
MEGGVYNLLHTITATWILGIDAAMFCSNAYEGSTQNSEMQVTQTSLRYLQNVYKTQRRLAMLFQIPSGKHLVGQ